MRTTRNKASGLISRALSVALAVGLSLTIFAANAAANTGAGSVILNVAQVDYDDAAGTSSFSATSSASVTVNLVAAAPSILLPTPVDQIVGSGTTATYTYTITATANGSDLYDIGAAIGAEVNMAAGTTAVPSVASVTLGASVITAQPAANQIEIPAGSGANLGVGDIIVIGGVDYQISVVAAGTTPSHTNNTVATTTVGVTTGETPITITVIANAAGSNVPPAFAGADVGTVAGEQAIFTVDVTGTTAGPGDGTSPVDITVSSNTVPAQSVTDPIVTTFQANFVSILKLVGPVGGPYAATATGNPGDTLEYQITMTNTSASNATAVTLTDAVPAYTTYVTNSTRLNTITVAGDGAASPLAGGLLIDDDGARGGGGVATGIIGGLNSAVVTFQVTIN